MSKSVTGLLMGAKDDEKDALLEVLANLVAGDPGMLQRIRDLAPAGPIVAEIQLPAGVRINVPCVDRDGANYCRGMALSGHESFDMKYGAVSKQLCGIAVQVGGGKSYTLAHETISKRGKVAFIDSDSLEKGGNFAVFGSELPRCPFDFNRMRAEIAASGRDKPENWVTYNLVRGNWIAAQLARVAVPKSRFLVVLIHTPDDFRIPTTACIVLEDSSPEWAKLADNEDRLALMSKNRDDIIAKADGRVMLSNGPEMTCGLIQGIAVCEWYRTHPIAGLGREFYRAL